VPDLTILTDPQTNAWVGRRVQVVKPGYAPAETMIYWGPGADGLPAETHAAYGPHGWGGHRAVARAAVVPVLARHAGGGRFALGQSRLGLGDSGRRPWQQSPPAVGRGRPPSPHSLPR
jgi:hypothetical protein